MPFYPEANYKDLLDFESNIAQICELVMLFSESAGSLCELGAFSMDAEISRKLLTVIQRRYYDQESFITLGPLKAQINHFGQESVYVLNDEKLGIKPPDTVANLNLTEFEKCMEDAISQSLKRSRRDLMGSHTTFNPSRPGHVIKLIVGIIQHYGALTRDEIDVVLYDFGINLSQDAIENYILCAKFVGWLSGEPIGARILYYPKIDKPALYFKLKDSVSHQSADAWLVEIREYWKSTDPDRFDVISKAAAAI